MWGSWQEQKQIKWGVYRGCDHSELAVPWPGPGLVRGDPWSRGIAEPWEGELFLPAEAVLRRLSGVC